MNSPTPLRNILAEFLQENEQWTDAKQLGVVAISLLLAWLAGRFLRTRTAHVTPSADARTRFGVGGAHRLVFPVFALVLVVASRYVFERALFKVSVLNLAVPLLSSMAIIRAAVYLLRTAFDEARWVGYWERAIAWIVWLGVALHLTGVLAEIASALDALSFEVSGKRVSVLSLLQAPVVIALAIVLGLWVGRLIERRLMGAEQVDLNVRVVLSRLIRVVLIVLAVLIALPALGIDVTVLSVFGGALGVGIGFGLQKVASNYVSGFTILLDRSISPGALVTIEHYYGQVVKVAARYIVVRGLDGTEAIVPNETVVTSVVINHSFSDPVIRLELTVQVGYRSDVEAVLQLLETIGAAHPRTLKQPKPLAILSGFGDNGINLGLYVWISDPEAGKANVCSDIYREIWRAFQREGIEIPYPQRDVRILGETSLQNPASPP